MDLTSSIAPRKGLNPEFRASIRHSKLQIRHSSHSFPAPRPELTRPDVFKSHFLAAPLKAMGSERHSRNPPPQSSFIRAHARNLQFDRPLTGKSLSDCAVLIYDIRFFLAIFCVFYGTICSAQVLDIYPLKESGGRIEVVIIDGDEKLVWRDQQGQRQVIASLDYPLQSGIVESPKGGQIIYITGSHSAGTWPVIVDLAPTASSARAPLGDSEGEGIGPVLDSARRSAVTDWSASNPVSHVYSKIAGWNPDGDWLIRINGDGELREFGVKVPRSDAKLQFLRSDELPDADIAGLSTIGAFTSFSGSGTGFFISDDGYIATALHVVEKVSRVRVDYDGVSYEARGAGFSREHDLHLIKIEPVKPTPYIRLSIERPDRLGVKCFTIGYPLTSIQGFSPKFTEGTISSLTGIDDDPTSLQISVPVQPGNSGGALVSESGLVLGMIQSGLSSSAVFKATGGLPQNVNYARHISLLLPLIKKAEIRVLEDEEADMSRDEAIAAAQAATVRVITYK
jgi:hypothetical protein